jgi:hypothetical protein
MYGPKRFELQWKPSAFRARVPTGEGHDPATDVFVRRAVVLGDGEEVRRVHIHPVEAAEAATVEPDRALPAANAACVQTKRRPRFQVIRQSAVGVTFGVYPQCQAEHVPFRALNGGGVQVVVVAHGLSRLRIADARAQRAPRLPKHGERARIQRRKAGVRTPEYRVPPLDRLNSSLRVRERVQIQTDVAYSDALAVVERQHARRFRCRSGGRRTRPRWSRRADRRGAVPSAGARRGTLRGGNRPAGIRRLAPAPAAFSASTARRSAGPSS